MVVSEVKSSASTMGWPMRARRRLMAAVEASMLLVSLTILMLARVFIRLVPIGCGAPGVLGGIRLPDWDVVRGGPVAQARSIVVLHGGRIWAQGQIDAGATISFSLPPPPREREFIDAMAALPAQERALTHIALGMGYEKPTAAGPTSQRLDVTRGLIERGKPYRFRHRAVEAYLTTDWPHDHPTAAR